MSITDFLLKLNNLLPTAVSVLRTIIFVLIALIIFRLILSFVKNNLLKRVTSKKQRHNVEIFSNVLWYVFLLLLVIFSFFSYAGSWTGLGIGIGLFSAAIGFALQRPISGIAAWIMIVTRRPFEIGDRIVIGTVRGDVKDITLTHVYIAEIGGIVNGEEHSGRITLVPNSVLFEQNIINYTLQDEYVLDQVNTLVTFESNVDNAIKICEASARRHLKEVIITTNKGPYIRTFFDINGMQVIVRYFAPAKRLQEYSSKITKEIYDNIKKTKDVHFAHAHMQVNMNTPKR